MYQPIPKYHTKGCSQQSADSSGVQILGFCTLLAISSFRSRPGKPNQRKGQNKKFMNFAHFCEFWCFSLGKQARFTLNFCSGMPLRKVHELTFLWFGLPGPLLIAAFVRALLARIHFRAIPWHSPNAIFKCIKCKSCFSNRALVKTILCKP